MEDTIITFLISETSVHVAEVSRSTKGIQRQEFHRFTAFREHDYKSELSSVIEQLKWNWKNDNIVLAWCTNKATLVPAKVMGQVSIEELSSFLFGDTIEKKNLDYNRLPELDVVNVFEIPLWVKSFFVIKFPLITIVHEQTAALRAHFETSNFKFKLEVSINEDYLSLYCIENNELKFSNNFEFQTAEDIVYYIVYVLKQKSFEEKTGTLTFSSYLEESSDVIKKAIHLLESNKLVPNLKIQSTAKSSFLNLLTCV